ncbi:sigma-70 family RNA polymerase sigma factor [Verrucomicrobia bacterium]|nr:sigma-70 family RNA polymerase sigma factor [Verrucomicrobiota bacterium]
MKADILIQRYLSHGDSGAARDLFRNYEEGLYGYLWQMLKHQQDCEDALQDTFRKALEALPTYREESHFKSWLFRIGHNTGIEIIRRRKRIVEMPEALEAHLDAPSSGPREFLIQREREEELQDAIAALPQSERAVVLLRLQEELSFKEIAQVLDAPIGTVLARMHKAKKRLRAQLNTT